MPGLSTRETPESPRRSSPRPSFDLGGNGRDLAAGFGRWTVPVQRPRVALTWNGRYLSYDEPETGRSNGYFAPHSFWANVAGLEVSQRFQGKIGLSAQGTLGIQRVRVEEGSPTNSDTVRGYYLTASYDLGSRVTVAAYFGRTNLALQGPTGFSSTESGIRVGWKTGWPAPGVRGLSGASGTDGGGGDQQ